jgi:glycosyltransferase involved in cell wall biosynthesis
MDVSVVVPAYNAAATVAASVRSALGQTVGSLEVIVVDDGSTDDTAAVVTELARGEARVRLVSQANAGLPAARNAGIRAARGRFVAFLDSDDLLLPRYLSLAAEALDADPGAALAYTDALVFDPVSGRVRERTAMARSRPPVPAPADRDGFLYELLQRNFVFVATVVRRTVLEQLGGFDASLRSAEDYDLWLRILLAGHRAVCVPGTLALYRKHPGQMSRNLALMSENVLAVYERLALDTLPSDAHRALVVMARRRLRRETRILRLAGRAVPVGLAARLKRSGVGEAWYERAPLEVEAAFPDLRAA